MVEEADDEKAKKKRGPKGGIKHRPGRGHRRKSERHQKNKFAKKAENKRNAKKEELRKKWTEWDSLPPDVQRMRPELEPDLPRPEDEN